MISAGLDIDRILHFVFYDKILQIYRQNWVRKFYHHIFLKYRKISKNWGVGVLILRRTYIIRHHQWHYLCLGWLTHLVSRFAYITRVIVDGTSNPLVSHVKLLQQKWRIISSNKQTEIKIASSINQSSGNSIAW